MTVFEIVLALTNLITLGVLALVWRRPARPIGEPDPCLDAAVAGSARVTSTASTGRARRFITVEILNPIELAGARHRMFGIAGSFVPDLTRRIVYDQTLKILRRQLAAHQVVAEVRIHTLPPDRSNDEAMTPEATVAAAQFETDAYLDDVSLPPLPPVA